MSKLIDEFEMMEHVLGEVPEFRGTWHAYRQQSPEGEPGPCASMYPFVDFAAENARQRNSNVLKRIFDVAEYLLVNGNQNVRDAVGPCFLEGIVNWASAGHVTSLDFVEFLGPESIRFIRAWDEFTGVKTEGLW